MLKRCSNWKKRNRKRHMSVDIVAKYMAVRDWGEWEMLWVTVLWVEQLTSWGLFITDASSQLGFLMIHTAPWKSRVGNQTSPEELPITCSSNSGLISCAHREWLEYMGRGRLGEGISSIWLLGSPGSWWMKAFQVWSVRV